VRGVTDDPELAEFGALAAKKKRFLWALLGNVVLLVVMLGGPFLRGVLRAHALWQRFGTFAGCIYGGTPIDGGGLGIPIGSEAQFAARLLARAPDWPERCLVTLRALLPDEPTFLLPSVKRAENDVRTAASIVERELEAVLVRVPGERMSTRPLRAIDQLRGILTRHALTAGVIDLPEDDAITLDPRRGLPIPTRVPIYASSDARIALWGGDSELHGLALDGNGVSYVHVAGGSMSQARLPRPKLLEAFVPGPGGGWFVWAMPQRRCRERAEGCAKKALGVAALVLPLSTMPFPRWFGAHPAGRIDRSMWFAEERFLVVAEAPEQQLQQRLFQLPPEPADEAASALPPVAASQSSESVVGSDVWLGTLAGEPLSLFATHAESGSELWQLREDGPHSLAQLAGSQSVWLSGKSCADHVALVFGTERELRVARLGGEQALTSWPVLPLGLTDVVHERDPSHDRVRLACVGEGRTLLLVRDSKDTLRALACAPGGACEESVIAGAVQSFAVETHDDTALVAFAGARGKAQVRLVTLDVRGQVRQAERVPSACWEPRGGLCGTPTLQRVGQRLLLGSREGTDLLLLESADQGASWEPLRGLKRLH
jgi:hypothetical protein